MATLTSASVLSRARDVRYRVLAGEAVVVRQGPGEVLGLNEVGAQVLDRLDGKRSVAEVVADLLAVFEVEGEELERDVLAFLDLLLQRGVVTPASAGAQAQRGSNP